MLLTSILLAVLAAPFVMAGVLQERAVNVCASGIYAQYSPLAVYPVAQAYCKGNFPPQCTGPNLVARNPITTPTTITTAPRTTPKKTTTTNMPVLKLNDPYSLWVKLRVQDYQMRSTVCSCVQQHKPCSTTTTMTTTNSVPFVGAGAPGTTTRTPPRDNGISTRSPTRSSATPSPTPYDNNLPGNVRRCSDYQINKCGKSCFCGITLGSPNAGCYDNVICSACTSDDACAQAYGASFGRCAYYAGCDKTSGGVGCMETNTNKCPANPNVKRALEHVFENARKEKMARRALIAA